MRATVGRAFYPPTSHKSVFFKITIAHRSGTFLALHTGRKLRFARVARKQDVQPSAKQHKERLNCREKKGYKDEIQIQDHSRRTRADVHAALRCSSFRAYYEYEYGKPEHEFSGDAVGKRSTLGVAPSSPPPPAPSHVEPLRDRAAGRERASNGP